MKAVILVGGFGTRLSEETTLIPKPMVPIGGKPVLWHIMKIFSHYGINEFILCLGYKSEIIKNYFRNYRMSTADVTINTMTGEETYHSNHAEPWRVTMIETGLDTMTGGRLKRIAPYVADGPFCMTYGDGVADIDIGKLIATHKAAGLDATVTAVHQPSRYGTLVLEGSRVNSIREKAEEDGSWINGGFFVLNPGALDHLSADSDIWELQGMNGLTAAENLAVYRHNGFWQSMDNIREKDILEDLWSTENAPWKVW